MDLRKLRHAVTLFDCRSYIAAAGEANITPSALSRSIQALEEETGLVLFDRGRGGVHPTTAGRHLVAQARPLLLAADALRQDLRAISSAQAGDVAFGLGPLPASLYLSRFFTRLLKAAPGITTHVAIEPGTVLVEQLTQGRIEFFLCAESALTPTSEMAVTKFDPFPLFVHVRRGHPLVDRQPISLADIEPFPLLGGGLHALQRSMWPLRERNGLSLHISCDNYHILRNVVASTDGVLIGPRSMGGSGQERDDVLCLAYEDPFFPKNGAFMLVRMKERTLSSAANMTIETLSAIVRETDLG